MSTPTRRSSTPTIISALRILARDVQSQDGVANEALREAADRMEELAYALSLFHPHCAQLHHAKKHQHKVKEPCPVEAIIEKAKSL